MAKEVCERYLEGFDALLAFTGRVRKPFICCSHDFCHPYDHLPRVRWLHDMVIRNLPSSYMNTVFVFQ